jgi:hypothetical protein
MNKEELKKLAAESNHIAGIYNYCDRWCERCAFTSRCLNYKMSEEKFGDPESKDIDNAAFWEKLSETFQETLSLLKEMAEEQGIDLDSIDIDSETDRRDIFEEDTVVHIVLHLSKNYMHTVDEWFDNDIYHVGDAENEANVEAYTAQIDAMSEDDTSMLEDSVEVIRWYQHQIYVKLRRALSSAQDETFEEEDNFPKDSDGSAKVALMGIDRSISAWGKVLEYFPWQKEILLGIIADLKRLCQMVEAEFPDARAFVRPGFDEN